MDKSKNPTTQEQGFANETATDQSITPDWLTKLFADANPLPTTLNPAYDLNLPGPSNYLNLSRPTASPVSNALNPTDFMWAMSSQLPMMEESSPADVLPEEERIKGKIVKISWWRPHGQTAIAPGEYAENPSDYRLETDHSKSSRQCASLGIAGGSSFGLTQYIRSRWRPVDTCHEAPFRYLYGSLWLSIPFYR